MTTHPSPTGGERPTDAEFLGDDCTEIDGCVLPQDHAGGCRVAEQQDAGEPRITRGRPVMYASMEYKTVDGTTSEQGLRYFPTATKAKAFAKEQMRERGGTGYAWYSLTRESVAQLLRDFVPDEEVMGGGR